MQLQQPQQSEANSRRANGARAANSTRSTRKPVRWDAWPRDMLGALVAAGRGTLVAMQGVTYREAHSMRTRLRFMQTDIVKLYASTPARLVDIAQRVHWFVEDDQGVRELRGKNPKARDPVWKLVGVPSVSHTSDLRLPKNVDKLIEEAIGAS